MAGISALIKSLLRKRGLELVRLRDDEKKDVPLHAELSFREAQAYRAMSWQGQISLAEARFLGELVRSSDPARPIIEIGTLFGFSTTAITLFKQQSQQLITVDNYCWNPLGLSPKAHFEITRNRLTEAISTQNVKLVHQDKDEFYRTYQGPPPALFYCDANHSYEASKADLAWARSVGAAIICGDDYHPDTQPGVTRAVDELGGPKQLVHGLFVL